MLSKEKTYATSDLDIESNSLSFKNSKTDHQIRNPYLNNSLIIKQYSGEVKLNEIECSNPQTYQNGRWTHEENQRFIEALFIYGADWKRVQCYIKTRTSIQSRSHAQKFFITFNKKFKEVYGKEQNEPKLTPPKAEYILNILSKMHNCKCISSLCKNMSLLVKENNMVSLKGFTTQEDKDEKSRSITSSSLRQTLEERKDNFIKVIHALMKISSRTKNNSNMIKQTQELNYINHSKNNTINNKNSQRTLCSHSANHLDENEVSIFPNQTETYGTGIDYSDNQMNINKVFNYPFHLISDEDNDYFEGHFIHDNPLDLEMPLFFGQGK